MVTETTIQLKAFGMDEGKYESIRTGDMFNEINNWVNNGPTPENGAPEDLAKCRVYMDDLEQWNARNAGCFADLASGTDVMESGRTHNITYHVEVEFGNLYAGSNWCFKLPSDFNKGGVVLLDGVM